MVMFTSMVLFAKESAEKGQSKANVENGAWRSWCNSLWFWSWVWLERLWKSPRLFSPWGVADLSAQGWKEQAREYLYRFDWDLERASPARNGLVIIEKYFSSDDGTKEAISFSMRTPTLVVLFHPEMSRTSPYESLNFILSYWGKNTLSSVLQNVDSESYTRIKELLLRDISRLDYFIEFQMRVQSYLLDILRKVAKQSGFPRLPLIKELDFSTNMVGQRLAKHASN